MREEKYQPKMPDIMEAIFDAGYLIFDLVAAILFFTYAKGNTLFILYGILTLTLCGGDAFHLVPRTAWDWITDILNYNDCILYYFNVCLEVYFPRF